MEIKYLYFEVHWVNDEKPEMRNENVLLIQPQTNSSGSWGFRNCTHRNGTEHTKESFWTVDQSWIDLTKYQFTGRKGWDDPVFYDYDKWVKECLDKVTKKLTNS